MAANAAAIITSFDSLEIDVAGHSWIGDLTATLTSPGGDNVQLFRRPGVSGVGSDGDWLTGTFIFVASGGLAVPNAGNWAAGT